MEKKSQKIIFKHDTEQPSSEAARPLKMRILTDRYAWQPRVGLTYSLNGAMVESPVVILQLYVFSALRCRFQLQTSIEQYKHPGSQSEVMTSFFLSGPKITGLGK